MWKTRRLHPIDAKTGSTQLDFTRFSHSFYVLPVRYGLAFPT